MASQAVITIRVGSTRSASSISYRTSGRYISTPTTGLEANLAGQPVQPTGTLKAFWTSVLEAVLADVEASS